MAQLTDEQIQQLLEAGLSLPDTSSGAEINQAQLYQRLFAELKQELPISPDADFSGRVMNRIEAAKAPSTVPLSYGWFGAGLAICLLAGLFMMTPFRGAATDLLNVFASLKPFKWELVFSIVSLLVVQWLDLKLIGKSSGRLRIGPRWPTTGQVVK